LKKGSSEFSELSRAETDAACIPLPTGRQVRNLFWRRKDSGQARMTNGDPGAC